METAHVRYMRENRQFFRANGMCTACGATDAFTMAGRWLCSDCTDKRNAYMTVYREENREKMREYGRSLAVARKNGGRCVKCGRDMGGDPHASCARCRAIDAERQRRKRASRRNDVGVCYMCAAEPVIDGKRVCADCYEKACASAANARRHVDLNGHPWQRDETIRRVAGRAAV